jgi:hypothetical protein
MNRDTFISNVLQYVLPWLSDNIFAIREMGCKVIKKMHQKYLGDDLEKKIYDKLVEMKGNTNYLIRNTILIFLRVLFF